MEESCIYSCKVTREDTGGTETYTGLVGGIFKSRFYGHKARSTTGLGAQMARAPHYPRIYNIWDLKDSSIPFNTKWSILAKAPTFNPTTKNCRLCKLKVIP